MGYATIMSPGADPYVITVGATNTNGTPNRSDDVMASFSSKGPTMIDHVCETRCSRSWQHDRFIDGARSTLATNNPNLVVRSSPVLGDVSLDDGTPGYSPSAAPAWRRPW